MTIRPILIACAMGEASTDKEQASFADYLLRLADSGRCVMALWTARRVRGRTRTMSIVAGYMARDGAYLAHVSHLKKTR